MPAPTERPEQDRDQPVLPTTPSDEGWGDRAEEADSDDERYLRERPPHHEG